MNFVSPFSVADLYERCISKNKNLHYLSTLEQLTQFQDNIQDLLSRINVIPIQFVSEAKAFVSKNMEETNRSATNAKRKLNELDNYLQHLERTLMPKYKKVGTVYVCLVLFVSKPSLNGDRFGSVM